MRCDVCEVAERLENELCSALLCSFSNLSVTSSRHNSFSNPSIALPISQLILQPFRCFTYITVHSPTHLSILLRHRLVTYETWRLAHEVIVIWVVRERAVVSHEVSQPLGVTWPDRTSPTTLTLSMDQEVCRLRPYLYYMEGGMLVFFYYDTHSGCEN